MKKYGIDISEHNGNIDLKPYVGAYVIIRAGWGQGHKDKKFDRNIKECERLGIPYGVYWYSYALNTAEAAKEANYFIDIIKGCNVTIGAWLDMEDADGWKKKNGWTPNKSRVSAIVKTFCGAVEKSGFYTGTYLSYAWYQYLDDGARKFDRWIAHWGNNDGKRHGDYKAYGSIHQYTSKPLDKDFLYKTTFRNPGGSTPDTKPVKTLDDMVKGVLLGEYGTGAARKKALGTDYDRVQARVNKILTLARKTARGLYGNGPARKRRLGADYDLVQWVINHNLYK